MNPTPGRLAITAALFGALLIATFLVYLPGLQGPFMLDDAVHIPRTAVSSLDWPEIKRHIFWDDNLGGLSRGLTNLTFSLSQFGSGVAPYSFKYQNTLLHLINGALVFWLSSLLLGLRTEEQDRANMLALAITAIWLLHPLQVSTVLYAVQRLVLLSSLFVLLAVIVYVKGRIWGSRRPVAAFLTTSAGVAFFGALGMLSKENAALLPLYLLAVELFFFRLQTENPLQKRLLVLLLGLFIALPMLAGLAYLGTHLEGFLAGYVHRPFTLEERLLTEVHAIAMYLKLFFVPLPAGMSLFHDNFPIQRHLDPATLGLAMGYAGLIVTALLIRKTHPGIGFGILWFFISHLLESTIIALELVFEHRNYLAILGLAFVLVLGVARLLDSPTLKRVTPILALALVALLAFTTASRAFVWGNGELMLRTQYQQRPDSLRVLEGLFHLERQRGNLIEARLYLDQARRLDPDSPHLAVNEMRTYCSTDSFYPAGMELEAQRLIEMKPNTSGLATALSSLTMDFLSNECPGLEYPVVYDLVSSYANSEGIPTSRMRLRAMILQGRLLTSQGRWSEAEAVYASAIDYAGGKLEGYADLSMNQLSEPFVRSGNLDGLRRLLEKVGAARTDDTQ